jgi:hypothetical protein
MMVEHLEQDFADLLKFARTNPNGGIQSDSLQTNLDTYAKSARLPVLREGTGGELRLWVTVATFNARTEGIETMGYVYSGDHSSVSWAEASP